MPAASPTSRGHKKRERTRSQLLDAAVAVLAERGESFTVSDVVERAGVSNGTFYNYFDDRDALLAAVGPKLLEAFAAESAGRAPRDDAALRVATITARLLLGAAAEPTRARALLRMEMARALGRDAGATAYLREDLADGLAQGRFAIESADAAVDLVAGALWMGIRRAADDEPVPPGYAAGLLAGLLRALGVTPREVTRLAERALELAGELGPPRFTPRPTN